ncbi:MAG TPA: T9SS type A sorting domain-containing protein [Bacteroidia bacterium]|nr:T9SS type A sorting domain-containing protein [Bacteroidia bacterium]
MKRLQRKGNTFQPDIRLVRFLFFWIILLNLLRSYGQVINFAQHGLKDNVSGLVCINNKCYYLERREYGHSLDSLNLVGVGDNGSIFLKKKLHTNSNKWTGKLIHTLDNGLACIYQTQNFCDYPSGYAYFDKLDTLGNLIFSVNVSTIASQYNYLVDFIQYPDGTYYLLSATEILHYSNNGGFLTKHNLGSVSLKAIGVLNNGNLFISESSNIYELSPGFSTVQIVPSAITLKKICQSPSGRIYALSNTGTIWRYNSLLSPLYGATYGNFYCSDFVCRSDTVYYTGYSVINGQPFYSILDSALFQIYYTNNGLQGIYPQALDIDSKNRVHLVSRGHNVSTDFGNAQTWKMNFRTYFRFPKFGNFSLQNDLAVNSFTLLSPFAYQNGLGCFNANLEVEVKNLGNDTVRGFNLNTELWFICNQSWQKWYDSILAPGASVKVKTGFINMSGSDGFSVVKLCFYTSTPGLQADANPANDWYCKYVVVSPAALNTNNTFLDESRVFPNPFTSEFTIQSQFEIMEIKVFNAMGLLVWSQIGYEKETPIELGDIKDGIYILSVETEKGVFFKKLIKH